MPMMLKLREKRPAPILVCLWCLVLAGCGSAAQSTILEPGFELRPNPLISVGEITNVSPPYPNDEEVELDPLQELRTQLEQQLQENDMLMTQGSAGNTFALIPEIKEYRPGSAFKRWLWPGYGSTILWVESELREGNKKVGTISTKRTVDAGGAYTAGAYRSIFGSVAEDIVTDLKKKLSPG